MACEYAPGADDSGKGSFGTRCCVTRATVGCLPVHKEVHKGAFSMRRGQMLRLHITHQGRKKSTHGTTLRQAPTSCTVTVSSPALGLRRNLGDQGFGLTGPLGVSPPAVQWMYTVPRLACFATSATASGRRSRRSKGSKSRMRSRQCSTPRSAARACRSASALTLPAFPLHDCQTVTVQCILLIGVKAVSARPAVCPPKHTKGSMST